MTEEGKTQAACCKAWLIECEPHVVRHPATQQKQLDLGLRVTLAGLKKGNPQHLFTVNTHTTYFLSAYYTALPCNNQYKPTFYGTRS